MSADTSIRGGVKDSETDGVVRWETAAASEAERDARGWYERGITRMLAAQPDGLGALCEAIAAKPDLAVAHAALAVARREVGDVARAAHHADEALAIVGDETPRTASHVQALVAVVRGQPEAIALLQSHLRAWPNDAFVFEQLQRFLFFHGGVGRREALIALCDQLAPAYPNSWYFRARRALHLQEVHRYDEARAEAEASLEMRPGNVPALHALVHALHGTGRHGEALHLIEKHLAAGTALGPLDGHLAWHAAIVHLGNGNTEQARVLFEDKVSPRRSPGPRPLALADAAALLAVWRVGEYDRPPDGMETWALARDLARGPGRPFVDVHAALAFAGVSDIESLERLACDLGALASADPLAAAGRAIVLVVLALATGDPGDALARLDALDDTTREALGGSNIERAIVDVLRVEALRGAGMWSVARASFASGLGPDSRAHPILASLAAT